jgi:starch phosphorylase
LTPQFSANRTVREYTEEHYLPAARAYQARAAEKGRMGSQIVGWRQTLEQNWVTLRFGEERVETNGDGHVFEIEVYLNELDPSAVRVELYANGANGEAPLRQEMTRIHALAGAIGGYAYKATVPATRPASDYTARIIPHHEGAAVPLEASQILWQR